MTDLIAFSDVVARVEGGPTIEIADAAFARGGLHVIVGANGSGKSTLLKLMLGFLPIVRGQIRWRIDEASWVLAPRTRLPDDFYQHIGYLQQGPESLWPQFDVLEHIERAIIHRRARLGLGSRSDVRDHAMAVLERLQIDRTKWRRRLDSATVGGTVQRFSGGERQRISFGRAIAARPDILVLDELEAALDAETQARLIKGYMRDFVRDPSHTAFVVTHDPANWAVEPGQPDAQTWRMTKVDDRIHIAKYE